MCVGLMMFICGCVCVCVFCLCGEYRLSFIQKKTVIFHLWLSHFISFEYRRFYSIFKKKEKEKIHSLPKIINHLGFFLFLWSPHTMQRSKKKIMFINSNNNNINDDDNLLILISIFQSFFSFEKNLSSVKKN